MHSHYVESTEKVRQLLEEYMAQVLLAPCLPLPPVITAAVGTVFCPNPQWLDNHSQNLISSVPSKMYKCQMYIHRQNRMNLKGNSGFPDLLHIF